MLTIDQIKHYVKIGADAVPEGMFAKIPICPTAYGYIYFEYIHSSDGVIRIDICAIRNGLGEFYKTFSPPTEMDTGDTLWNDILIDVNAIIEKEATKCNNLIACQRMWEARYYGDVSV